MNKAKRNQIIAYLISAILVVLIGIKLYTHFSQKSSTRVIPFTMEQRDLDIVFGSDTAELAIYMYSNYGCNYCRLFFNEVYPALNEKFISKGKVKLIMRLAVISDNYDLINSLKAAVCVNEHGNFQYLHQLMLINYGIIFTPDFQELIDEFIEKDTFVAECILGGEAEEYLNQNVSDLEQLGIKGTPSFIINNSVYVGFKNYEILKEIISKHINKLD